MVDNIEKLKRMFPKLMIDHKFKAKINKMETTSNEFVVAKYFLDVFLKLGLTQEMVLQLKKDMPEIIEYANKNANKNANNNIIISRKSQKGGQLVNETYCRFILIGIILVLLTQIEIPTNLMIPILDEALLSANTGYGGIINSNIVYLNRTLERLRQEGGVFTAYDMLNLITRVPGGPNMLIPPMFMDNPDLSIAIVAFFFMLILFSLDIGFFIGANFMVRQIDQVPVPAPVPARVARVARVAPVPAQVPAAAAPPIAAAALDLPQARPLNIHPDDDDDDDVPREFQDPIMCRFMTDPVTAAFDGQTYDRSFIENWLEGNNISPLTRGPIDNRIKSVLIPNYRLREQMEAWWANLQRTKAAAAAAAAAAAERNTAATRLQRWTRRNLAKQKSAKPAASNGGSRRRRCSKRCKRKHRTQTKR